MRMEHRIVDRSYLNRHGKTHIPAGILSANIAPMALLASQNIVTDPRECG